jgi:hypothetical protein
MLLFTLHMQAQLSSTGTLNGTLTDKSGAVVAGASVRVHNSDTGVDLSTQSNGDGNFVVPGLAVGTYTVTILKQGFQGYVVKGIAIHPAVVANVNAVMEVGREVSQVTVTASAAQVQTSTGEVSNQISQEQVVTLPLNGRNYQSLSALVPGTVSLSPGTALNQGGRTTGNVMSINGMGDSGTLYTLDGIWNMNTGNMGQTTITPNPDTIQEVRVLQNNYSVQYSLMGANVVLLQTRSGTDTFHGSAYEYLRNDALDARNFFSDSVPPLKQNIFGYTIGGPLYIPNYYNTDKQKSFFFWSQQWPIQHIGSVLRGATPTLDMRNGLFTDPITNPQTGQLFPQDASGQYQIPPGMINSSSLALMNALMPPPNNPAAGFLNYINLSPQINTQRDDEIKIDHNFSPKLRLTGEYLDERQTSKRPNIPALGAPFGTNAETDLTQNQLAQLQLTAVISPSMVNAASVAMNNYVLYLRIRGITELTQVPDFHEVLPFRGFGSDRLPFVSFTGGWSSLGVPISRPLSHASDLEDTVADDWSWLRGNHFIQAGTTIVLGTKRQTAFAGASNGEWFFSGDFTGDPIADYLLGDATTFTQYSTAPRPYIHYRIVSPYVQDRWKLNRRLTVNLGLRWEYMPIPHAQRGYDAIFDPTKYDPAKVPIVNPDGTITPTPNFDPLNGIALNGVNGVPLNFTTKHQYFAGPSAGFAWDVFGDGKTSLRGGYGITYTRVPTGYDCSYVCSVNPPRVLSLNLITPSFPDPTGAAMAPAGAPFLNSQDRALQPARVQSFSLTLEHEFPGNWFASLAGAGTATQHTGNLYALNQPLPDPPYDYNPIINSGTVFPFLYSPYQGYGYIFTNTSTGVQNFDALEVQVRHPVGHNLFLSAAYTWSHTLALERGTEFFEADTTPQNVYHPFNEYGTANLDVTHVLALSCVWGLPWFQNARGIKGAALGGWKYTGITTIQSGFAVDPGLSVNLQGLATRPDRVGAVKGRKSVNEWFNTNAFAQPPAGYFGNAGTGIIRGPGLVNFDTGFYKDFRIKERHAIEFRAELFNIFNHPNFNGIDAVLGSGTFGQVVSAADPRIAEFALRYQF